MTKLLDWIINLIRWWFTGKLTDDEVRVNRELPGIEPKILDLSAEAEREKEKAAPMPITGPRDHVNATPVIKEAWKKIHDREPTALETLYTQAIASLETGYGRIGQFGALAAQGKFNWGGLQKAVNADGTCPAGFSLGEDQGKVCFFVFNSDIDAAAQMIRELTKSKLRPGVIEAMKGSALDVARAMRGTDLGKDPAQNRTAWYEGTRGTPEDERITLYATAIKSHANAIADSLAKAGQAIQTAVKANSTGIGTSMILVGLGGAYLFAKSKLG